jgi:uncharacterized membrane protein YccC
MRNLLWCLLMAAFAAFCCQRKRYGWVVWYLCLFAITLVDYALSGGLK